MIYLDQENNQDLLLLINRNYYAKAHVLERMQELVGSGRFGCLDSSFEKFCLSIERELAVQELLFKYFNSDYWFGTCTEQVNYLEDLFHEVQMEPAFVSPKLALMFYLDNVKCILNSTDQLLRIIINKSNTRFSELNSFDVGIFDELNKAIVQSFRILPCDQ